MGVHRRPAASVPGADHPQASAQRQAGANGKIREHKQPRGRYSGPAGQRRGQGQPRLPGGERASKQRACRAAEGQRAVVAVLGGGGQWRRGQRAVNRPEVLRSRGAAAADPGRRAEEQPEVQRAHGLRARIHRQTWRAVPGGAGIPGVATPVSAVHHAARWLPR